MIRAKLTGDVEAVARTRLAAKQARAGIRSAVGKIVRGGAKTAQAKLLRVRTGLLKQYLASKVKVYGDKVVGIVGAANHRVVLQSRAWTLYKIGREQVFEDVFTAVSSKTGKTLFLNAGSKLGHFARTRGKNKGAQIAINPAKYAHFVEFGHQKGKGKSSAPAYPFLKPAFDETSKTAAAEISQALNAQVGK